MIFAEQVKFVPSSLIIRGDDRRAENLYSVRKMASAYKFFATSKRTALAEAHVKREMYRFSVCEPSIIIRAPAESTREPPYIMKGIA